MRSGCTIRQSPGAFRLGFRAAGLIAGSCAAILLASCAQQPGRPLAVSQGVADDQNQSKTANAQAMDAGVESASTTAGDYLSGLHAERMGDVSDAAKFLLQALYDDPGSLELLQRTFLLTLSEGRVNEAIDLARRLNKVSPDAPLPALALGMLDFKNGKYESAAARFAKLPDTGLNKFVVPLMMAWYLHVRRETLSWRDFALAALLLLVPVGLIAKQPDLGTAMLIAASGFYVLFLGGLPSRVLALAAIGLAAFTPIAWHYLLHDYQRQRVLMREITDGVDELGVLLMGHAKGAYWYGSQLSVQEARKLAPHNNATSLQVCCAILGGIVWAVENPRRGIVEPDEMDHERVLEIAAPYLGRLTGAYSQWTPLIDRGLLFAEDVDHEDQGVGALDACLRAAGFAVSICGRHDQHHPAAYCLAEETFVPAGDDLGGSGADGEVERLVTVPGRIEDLARAPDGPDVLCHDHLALGHRWPAALDEGPGHQRGRRLAGGHLDRGGGAVDGGHGGQAFPAIGLGGAGGRGVGLEVLHHVHHEDQRVGRLHARLGVARGAETVLGRDDRQHPAAHLLADQRGLQAGQELPGKQRRAVGGETALREPVRGTAPDVDGVVTDEGIRPLQHRPGAVDEGLDREAATRLLGRDLDRRGLAEGAGYLHHRLGSG